MTGFSIWKFLAGIGFFLYGLQLLDRALSKLAGRPFKKFLGSYTQSTGKAILGGTLITALLQSSSIVQLITLGFVEAGIIPFKNALAVIMGSNLGSTMVGWIIATVGFKMDIESLAMPGLAISTIGMFFFQSRKNVFNSFRLLLSLSMLFFGLGMMKETAGTLVKNFDISQFASYHNVIFVIIGLIITTLVQTSSATMAITLTALNANMISFPAAASIVIGSEVGTAMKTFLSGLNGTGNKKRAAYGNFYFNLVTTVIALASLPWLIHFTRETIGIKDPLIGLAFFQSLINLVAIILFIPFLKMFSRWLEKQFTMEENKESYISAHLPSIANLALDAVKDECTRLLVKTIEFHDKVLDMKNPRGSFMGNVKTFARRSGTTIQEYNRLKLSEGELLEYILRVQTEELEQADYKKINQYMESLRNTIHAAKSVKDINHNIDELRESAKDHLHDFYHNLQEDWKIYRQELLEMVDIPDPGLLIVKLSSMMNEAFDHHRKQNENIRRHLINGALEEVEASTLLNIEREMISSKKSFVRSLAYLRLSFDKASEFEYFPENN
jgi:phosphate:Na+ symporter